MKRFEYTVLKMDLRGGFFSRGGNVNTEELSAHLSSYGEQGWELVNTVDTSQS